ncbi:MAG: 16S rRNA (guanine(527)-N(7))-methyltransferase RsmG [Cyanothece sp. SIO2G6]|nr:16S rRNA (guanine(527)-N(7))-methyltransferase RsmG [Cyanothece sp. SIO2G6]
MTENADENSTEQANSPVTDQPDGASHQPGSQGDNPADNQTVNQEDNLVDHQAVDREDCEDNLVDHQTIDQANKLVSHQTIDQEIKRVLDIGTGAGFPGLPVAIARPSWQITLLDSTRKKIAFIDSILPKIELTNVHTFTHRAETLGRNSHHRYQYDLVLVRAVAAATVCAEYALPFLKVGGQGVLYRGRWTAAEEESLLYALDLLGGTIEAIYEWETPLSQGDRHCIIIRKIEKTPRFFPRDVGVPAKDPLA